MELSSHFIRPLFMIARLNNSLRIASVVDSTEVKSVLVLLMSTLTFVAASATPKVEDPKSAADDSKAMYGQSCHKDVVVYVRAARVQHTAQSGQAELRWKYFLRMAHKGYSSSRPGLRFQLEPSGHVGKQVTGFSGYVILPPKEAVIHFAGLKAVGESVQKPIDYFANNVQGTISLLQAMQDHGRAAPGVQLQRHGVWRTAVPAAGRTAPHLGHQPLWPQQIAYRRDAGRPVRVRPGLARGLPALFQPRGRACLGLLGEDPQGLPNNLMPYVAKVAGGELPRLGVFGNDYDTPDGTGVRDYIHVMDLAQGHLAALQLLQGARRLARHQPGHRPGLQRAGDGARV
jgi:hypothetical protein